MKNAKTILIILVSFSALISACSKKSSSTQPQDSSTKVTPTPADCQGSNCKDDLDTTTATSESPTVETPVINPITPPKSELTNNVTSNLIQEIRDTRLLKTQDVTSFEEQQEINDKKTRNLTTANTLKRVDLDFDRKGDPTLKIYTKEGSYNFELSESQGSHYTLHSATTAWYNPSSWFGTADKPLFTATVDARAENRNVAILELTRHDNDYDSKVYIVFLRKFGQMTIQYPDTYSKSDLHPDSAYLLNSLSQIENVTANFYHVLTEFDEFNSSEATQFSIKFDILFSAFSSPNTLTTNKNEVPLEKGMVWFGSKQSPGRSFWFRAGDWLHNINASRQGHINALKKITYSRTQNSDGTKETPIESRTLNLRFDLKNRIYVKEQTQPVWITVDFL